MQRSGQYKAPGAVISAAAACSAVNDLELHDTWYRRLHRTVRACESGIFVKVSRRAKRLITPRAAADECGVRRDWGLVRGGSSTLGRRPRTFRPEVRCQSGSANKPGHLRTRFQCNARLGWPRCGVLRTQSTRHSMAAARIWGGGSPRASPERLLPPSTGGIRCRATRVQGLASVGQSCSRTSASAGS